MDTHIHPFQILKASWKLLFKLFIPIFAFGLLIAGGEILKMLYERNVTAITFLSIYSIAISFLYIAYVMTLVGKRFIEYKERANVTLKRLFKLIGAAITLGFAFLAASIPAGLAGMYAANTENTSLTLLGILAAIILALIPLFLSIRWYLVYPAIVLGEEGVFSSFGKSWNLTKDSFWRIVGLILIIFLSIFLFILFLIALGAAVVSIAPEVIENPVVLWIFIALVSVFTSPMLISQTLLFADLDKPQTKDKPTSL